MQVPSTVHCDHLIQARVGADADLKNALDVNSEVYEFLRSVSAKYGIGFWKPGSGIIHQVVLEQYAFPGGMMIGTDSHTPNAGGLGMVAIGVGGADAVDVMAGWPFNTRVPKVIGVHLRGELSGWAAAKDVILKVAGILTVKGGTGAIVEYFGPGAESISATGKATICNMGAEIGATCSLFPYDARSRRVPEVDRPRGAGRPRRRARRAPPHRSRGDGRPRAVLRPRDRHRPRRARAAPRRPAHPRPRPSDLRGRRAAREEGYPVDISYALVGSCTNSSYEDIGRAANVARQASAAGLRVKTPLLITPGSEQVRATIERDGLLADLEAIGATVLANACGPCIGQWQRDDIQKGETQHDRVVVQPQLPRPQRRQRGHACRSSARRRRSPRWRSPAASTSTSCASRWSRPTAPRCSSTRPSADELPAKGFDPGESGFLPPSDDPSSVDVVVKPDSERLELLEPFPAWDGNDFTGMQVLMKAVGKCTTDHISPAGPWLKYRGHLTNISGNLFIGVNNAFALEPAGSGVDVRDGSIVAAARAGQGATRTPASGGSRSATRTTARVRRVSTRRWSPGT